MGSLWASEGLLTESALFRGCARSGRASSVHPLTMIMPPQVTCISLPLQPIYEHCILISSLPKLFLPFSTQIIFRITSSGQPIPSLLLLSNLSNGSFQDYCIFVYMQYFMMLTTSSRKHPSFGAPVLSSGCHRWYHTLLFFLSKSLSFPLWIYSATTGH